MIFERNNMRVFVPLDPWEGARYIEPIKEEYNVADIDNIYHVTTKEQDCINPTEGNLSWENDNSCASNSEEELENLENM